MFTNRDAAEIAARATTRRELTAALIERGWRPDGQERAAVLRIQALRAERAARQRVVDPLLRARATRPSRLAWLREDRKRRAQIDDLLALPIAAHWRSDRRAGVAKSHDPALAYYRAIDATIEAVCRLATTRWGFTRRHTSTDRAGRATSRYLRYPGGIEVRISDHHVPLYGEREARYHERGPRWAEIVVGRAELRWTPEDWRDELRALADADAA